MTKGYEVTFEPIRLIVQVSADSIEQAAERAVDIAWQEHGLQYGEDQIETIEEEDYE